MKINNRKVSIVSYSTEANWIGPIPNENWLCILVDNDKHRRYVEDVNAKILDHNVSYVCAVGDQCERNHDLLDEEILIREVEKRYLPSFHIMTTWHDDFEEGIWFAFNTAFHENVDIRNVLIIDMTEGKDTERIIRYLERIR
ncbi:hypothetical protein [Pontibacter sp. G13]|uniref:DUF7684 family protein n=1 Tax=Pontibacter sp. G13 TaxID=3074898 RepID=UPI00288B9E00|nr:hypothetical protein [Pontibacter sp. G13]WNJ17138.1 hypothetical protein RJD25_19965 [Pontibacter sp. G13]